MSIARWSTPNAPLPDQSALYEVSRTYWGCGQNESVWSACQAYGRCGFEDVAADALPATAGGRELC